VSFRDLTWRIDCPLVATAFAARAVRACRSDERPRAAADHRSLPALANSCCGLLQDSIALDPSGRVPFRCGARSVKTLVISQDAHLLAWVQEAVHACEATFKLIVAKDVVSACTGCEAHDDLGLILLDLDSTGAGRSEIKRLLRPGPSPSIAVTRWLTKKLILLTASRAALSATSQRNCRLSHWPQRCPRSRPESRGYPTFGWECSLAARSTDVCEMSAFQVDHIEALVCGGRDELPNLQWLAIEGHEEKSRVEVKLCRAR
jgi:hypothetical protein